jgi:hypothetical protein
MKRSIRLLILGFLMVSISVLSLSTASYAQVGIGIGINVRIGPPALPVYAQPICPGPGYLWTPGYWAWSDDDGYYWVPGTWVIAPVGLLWTPGYWGFERGFYGWHAGYWGPHVGFYGGINYGFGYGGVGFGGGEWRGGAFFYNRAVMNINVRNVTNVYSKTVIVNNTHVAFNGPGGIEARPTRQEEEYGHERHTEALSAQSEHEHAASQNRELFARENHGRPAIAATGRPGEFSGHDVVRARAAGAAYHEPKMSPQAARAEGGNRSEPAHNEAVRNAERNDRPAARTENNRAQNNERGNQNRGTEERAQQTRNNEARNNEARNHQARNNEARKQARNSEAGNRGQKASHENSRPAKQEKAQKQARPEKPVKQAKSEPKHEGRR